MRGQRRRVRLTRKVFTDLAISMVVLGVLVGLAFPPFARVLGVPREYVSTPAFTLACVGAGVLMGITSWVFARTVVGRRLRLLADQLTVVAAAVDDSGRTGHLPVHATERIVVDSDDDLGACAGAFNALLEALERGEHFRALVRNASDVITVVDAGGAITYLSPSVAWILGYPPQSLVGTAVLDLVHPDAVAAAQGHLSALFTGTGAPIVARLRHRDGTYRWCETVSTDLRADPAVAGVVLSTRDVSERRRLEVELRDAAFHDHLTGLPNRALFMEALTAAESARAAAGTPLAVVFLDLDDLKPVNDTLGHEAGDELLRTVATRIAGAVRPGDVVARLAGDEFAVLLTGEDSGASADAVAARILASVSEPVRAGERDVRSGLSAGVAGVACAEVVGISTLRAADVAMYAAKTTGKNRVVTFTPEHHRGQLERERLHLALAGALERREMELHHEAVVRLSDERVVGHEALLRWRHPVSGLLPASAFDAAAQESGQTVAMGRWVLHEAIAQAAARRAADPRYRGTIAMGVSNLQLERSDVVADVTQALQGTGLDASELVLVVTEPASAVLPEAVVSTLASLRAMGVRIGVDEVGAGGVSFAGLRTLEMDALRISASLVSGVTTSRQDRAMVGAIVALADALGAQVVAGGVEDLEQVQVLRGLGVALAQGPRYGGRGLVGPGRERAATVVG